MRNLFRHLGGITLMAARALPRGVLPPYHASLVVVQIYRIGVSSLQLTVVAGLFAGMLVALPGAHELGRFGASLYFGPNPCRQG